MPIASRIRRLRALGSFVIDSYPRFGIGIELALSALNEGHPL